MAVQARRPLPIVYIHFSDNARLISVSDVEPDIIRIQIPSEVSKPNRQTLVLDRLAHKPKQTHSGQYHRYREQYYYPPQLVVTGIDCTFGFHLLFLFAFVVKRCNLIFTKSIVVNVNVIYQAVPITSCIF